MIRSIFALLTLAALVGCDAPLGEYPPNEVHALVLNETHRVASTETLPDTDAVMKSLFGTPSEPLWPVSLVGEDAAELIDQESLERAAGLVRSDESNTHFGLMVEHCATCHGLAGSGNGPASMVQNPYPRDFRAGVFKWKSTERAAKPTRQDIRGILQHGLPGTPMPSFAAIAEEDLGALTDYVIFLAIRGEVERRLMSATITELGYEETVEEADRLSMENTGDVISDVIRRVANAWADADGSVVSVPPETKNDADSIARGKEIFHGQIANCAGCHGKGGSGDAVTNDYDDWTKEYTTRIGITPDDRDAVKPFRRAGALKPRKSEPRNLTDGVFRGGSDPQTIYRRITQGIAGTPMPGIQMSENNSETGLTSDQIWDLVHYVRSLSGRETDDSSGTETASSQSNESEPDASEPDASQGSAG